MPASHLLNIIQILYINIPCGCGNSKNKTATKMHINPWKRICDVKINIHDDHEFSQSASEAAAAAAEAAQMKSERERISGGMTGIMMMV